MTFHDTRWSVAPVAERERDSDSWRLVLNCRPATRGARARWAATSLRASSRSDLFYKADRLTDDWVRAALAEEFERP
ncbi:MAG: hypothetical protein OEW17_03060 [Gemmatimonadota bacterium]|nr:hypothetical protein [Gemmatimonadota bacterium]MDH4347758.1 hypothetical protein [Gemmatimonadota bacterium]